MSRHYSRPPNCSLYIRNVPMEAKSEELKSIFSKYGPVSDVYIPVDYYTHKHRGFGYIQFDDPRDADDALYYANGMRYCGTELDLEFARSDRKTPHEMRRGGSPRGSRRTVSGDPRRGDRHQRRRSYSRSYSRSRSRSSRHRSDSRSRSPSHHSKRKSNKRSPSSDVERE